MTTQTEAQRLANSISRIDTFTEHQRSEIQKAAALMIRQDELLEQALEALKLADLLLSGANMNRAVVESKVRAAIAKVEGGAA